MRRLDLDYFSAAGGNRWLGIALVAFALVATAKLVDVYSGAKREVEQLEMRIAQLERRNGGREAGAPEISEATIREIHFANQVIDQISLPWDRLFRAIESAANARVALLGITPNLNSGTVEVSGESADLNTMFDYVKSLQRDPALAHVYLLNHQVNAQDPQRPVRFTVSASWTEKPSNS